MEKLYEYFNMILAMTVSGGVMILWLLLLHRILQKKVKKKYLYYTWLAAIILLTIPISIQELLPQQEIHEEQQDTFATEDFWEEYMYDLQNRYSANQFIWGSNPEQYENNSLSDWENTQDYSEKSRQEIDSEEIPKKETGIFRNFFEQRLKIGIQMEKLYEMLPIIVSIWLAGALMGLILFIVKQYKLRRELKKDRKVVAFDTEYYLMARAEANKLHSKLPELYYHSNISSPFLFGFFKTAIYLPEDIPIADFSIIVRHELIHAKRGDLWYRLLAEYCCILHWFNPFVYLMKKAIEEECELSCDEAVTEYMNREERKQYIKAILMTIYRSRNKYTQGSVTLFKNKGLMERRVDEIMNENHKNRWILNLTLVAVICLMVVGSWHIQATVMKKEKVYPTQKSELQNPEYQKEFQNITELNAYAYDGHIIIEKGDTFTISAVNLPEDYVIQEKNGILTLFSSKMENRNNTFDWRQSYSYNNYYNSDMSITITIPESNKLNYVYLDNYGGTVTAENFSCQKLTLDNGSGYMSLDGITAETTYLDTGSGPTGVANSTLGNTTVDTGSGMTTLAQVIMKDMHLDSGSGNVTISGSVTGESYIDSGSGNISMNLSEKTADYKIEFYGGSGNLNVNGKWYDDEAVLGEKTANNYIEIDTGSANVEIYFSDSDQKIKETKTEEVWSYQPNINTSEINYKEKEYENEYETEYKSQNLSIPYPEIKSEDILLSQEFEVKGVEALDIQFDNSTLYIYTTDSDKLKVVQCYLTEEQQLKRGLNGRNSPQYSRELTAKEAFTSNLSGGTLSILSKVKNNNYWNNWSNNQWDHSYTGTVVYLSIPKSFVNDMLIESGFGDIVVNQSIQAKKLTFHCGLGEMWIEGNINASNFKINQALGEIVVNGTIQADNVEIENNLGDTIMNNVITSDKISINSSLGDTYLKNDINCKKLFLYNSLGDCTIKKPVDCEEITINIGMGSLHSNGLKANIKNIYNNGW